MLDIEDFEDVIYWINVNVYLCHSLHKYPTLLFFPYIQLSKSDSSRLEEEKEEEAKKKNEKRKPFVFFVKCKIYY